MSGVLKSLGRYKTFEGFTEFFSHRSQACPEEMKFSVFFPPAIDKGPVPVLYWLSGLTCTEENFMVKAGAQRVASELGLMIVAPDTSPRGAKIPGEDDHWDFGTGAGFYVNATQEPWKTHYRMYDYVTEELPRIIESEFSVIAEKKSISGHSMGGHGAMVIALRNPGTYQSVSAFSPITSPSLCPWGQKAFGNYLGADRSTWAEYDANELVQKSMTKQPILIDQGTEDKFLTEQLMPENFRATCERVGYPIQLRMQKGYDHSFYFVSSFIEDHLRYHAKHLLA